MYKCPNPFRFLGAMWRAVFRREGKPLLVREEVALGRQAQCERNLCGRYFGGQCLECTCVVAFKVNFSTETCPLGFWDVDNAL